MVPVVYIAGSGRGGSTLLSRVLGSYPDCIAVGELYDIWHQGIQGDCVCGCGAPFLECSFWVAVMQEAFGGFDLATMERALTLRASVQSARHVPFMLFPRLRTSSYNTRLREYVGILEKLYLAIRKVSGREIIIDSSKLASYALVLSESSMIDVRLAHIIRDSRAAAFSWRRLKRQAAVGDRVQYLAQQSLLRSSVEWAVRNSIVSWTYRRFAIVVTLRYEELARQPRSVVTRLVDRLDITSQAEWISDDELISSSANHIFYGNPNRVEKGTIKIQVDDEWKTGMSLNQKFLVSAITLPTLWQFGYIGTRGGSEQPPAELRRQIR